VIESRSDYIVAEFLWLQ